LPHLQAFFPAMQCSEKSVENIAIYQKTRYCFRRYDTIYWYRKWYINIFITNQEPLTIRKQTWMRPTKGRVQLRTFGGGGGGDVKSSVSISTLYAESRRPEALSAPLAFGGQATPSVLMTPSLTTDGSTAISLLLLPCNSRLIGLLQSRRQYCQSVPFPSWATKKLFMSSIK